MAEAVRRLPSYRQCRQIFIAPDPGLAQLRINALLDGKELVVPGPGLKEGFYLLHPFRIPFGQLSYAVSLKGIPTHGQLLRHQELVQLAIDVLITDALAVDGAGNRLGDGSGFFDLACAVLQQAGALAEVPAIWAAGVGVLPEQLPCDPWDVRMTGLLSDQGVLSFPPAARLPEIAWQELSRQRIKKLTPLWKEWGRTPDGIKEAEEFRRHEGAVPV
jgi:5-formyltetrahydrofolate cyclo-ligase